MRYPDSKQSRKKMISRFLKVGGLAFAFLIIVSAGREWYADFLRRREIQSLETEQTRLDARRLELLELVKQFEQGDFLERQARLQFGLQRPGESVMVVSQPESSKSAEAETPPKSNPQLWWEYFTRPRK